MKYFLLCLFSTVLLFGKEMTIHLKDPSFQHNILKTEKGGVVETDLFRIQAETITYDKTKETIEASGDLMLIYEGRIFIGESLFYDMKTKSGEVIKGKTYDNLWIISGDKVVLKGKDVTILNASLTTSEVEPAGYDLRAREIKIENKSLVSAKSIAFRVYRIPIFYLPVLKANLDQKFDSPIRYNVTWDSGQGPKLSMRYCIYSWESASIFARLDVRASRGLGGAIETDYKSHYHDISGRTKSYLAHDTFWNDDDPNKKRTRWRLQGRYNLKSDDQKTEALFQYDWISDRNMPLDFKGDDFELNTAQRTEVAISHRNNTALTDLYIRPNINRFQGFKQQLPSLTTNIAPLEFGRSKIIMENQFEASFLDYEYASDLGAPIPSFHSIKLGSLQRVYRPFHLLHLNIVPSVGCQSLLYSNTPEHQSIITNILTYGVKVNTSLSRPYEKFSHVIEPYAHFEALRPMKNKLHYIFDLTDGYAHFKQLRVGALNSFYLYSGEPRVSIDLNALRFIGTRALSNGFSKLNGRIDLTFPRVSSYCDVVYNIHEGLYDRCNAGTKWTMSRYFAVGLDFLHRSAFDYRKDDPMNYILDATIPSSVLLPTPISVQRNLFLTRLEVSLPPNWTLRFQSHLGWARKNQPTFSEYRIDLFNTITSHWRFRLSYERFTNDHEVSFGLSIINF